MSFIRQSLFGSEKGSGKKFPRHLIISSLSLVTAFSLAFQEYQVYDPTLTEYGVGGTTEEGDLPAEEETIPVVQEQPKVDLGNGERYLVVGKGDTLNGMLIAAGVNKKEAHAAVTTVQKVYNVRHFRIGQGINVKLRHDKETGDVLLDTMDWRASPESEIRVISQNGKVTAKKHEIKLTKSVEGIVGKVQSNLHAAALKQGAPSNIAKNAIRYLSFDINFQHDVKAGSPFGMLYEVYRDPEGKIVKYGNLLYAAVMAKGKLKQIVRYENSQGVNYYTQGGECAVKSFMRTPLEVKRLRISSGYGLRMHPVRGYTAQHKGIDYSAPAGTPIVAAAGGVVIKAQYWSGFGLYVAVKHGDYVTEYGHMRKIASGIRPGVKVAQGQRLGEVGCTGTATGNHLHYGVLLKGRHINPASIKTTSSGKLVGKELTKFVAFTKSMEKHIKISPSQTEFVMATSTKMVG